MELSLDKGCTYIGIDDLWKYEEEIAANWNALMHLMDEDICEEIVYDVALGSESEVEFLAEYLSRASEDLILA